MIIELDKQTRAEAITSIQRYAEENFSEALGTLPATLLLDYFLEEIGPAIYNQAITDAQSRILQRTSDLTGELFADPFQYWPKKAMKSRRNK